MQNEATMMTFRASDGNTVKLEYHRSLPSASDLAKEYARRGYPDRYVVFAEKQTGASAVDGSVSDNNPESGLYLSCILRPSIFPSQAGALGALSAVAFALALVAVVLLAVGLLAVVLFDVDVVFLVVVAFFATGLLLCATGFLRLLTTTSSYSSSSSSSS
jgi:hypothetical protein